MKEKKILMVLTNVGKYNLSNRATGLWLGESIHFYDIIKKYGYEVDFVSPEGGYVPIDPHSMKSYFLKDIDWKWYNNKDFQNKALSNTLKPSMINAEDYLAVYYTGGHGVMWDFPNNPQLNSISMEIYNKGGYITSVCHGVVGLLNLKTSDEEYLINNRTITGFTNAEEFVNRTKSKVPFLTETELKKRGAKFMKKLPFRPYAIRDGRIITGQNPFSPKKVAELLIKALEEDKEDIK